MAISNPVPWVLLLKDRPSESSSPRSDLPVMDSASPTVFHMLERLVGKRVLAVINRDFGYEGRVAVVSHDPPGIWLTESEAVILRSTVVSPIPQIVNREQKGEIFLHLDAIQRLEAFSEGKASARR